MQETVQVGNTSIDECLKLMFSSLRFRSPSHRGETWDLKHHGCNGICWKNHSLMYSNFKIWTMFHMDGTLYYLYPVILNQLCFWHLMGFQSCDAPVVIVLRFVWILTVVLFIVTGIDAACTWWDRVSWRPKTVPCSYPNLMRWKSFAKKTLKKTLRLGILIPFVPLNFRKTDPGSGHFSRRHGVEPEGWGEWTNLVWFTWYPMWNREN